MAQHNRYVIWLHDVFSDDLPIVGEKAVHLNTIARAGFHIPRGFVINAQAYFTFIKENNLTTKIKHLTQSIDFQRPESLLEVSSYIQKHIMQSDIPEEIVKEIFEAYTHLNGTLQNSLVSLHTSVTHEKNSDSNAYVQNRTYPLIQGESNVIMKVKEAWAALFDTKMIYSRQQKNLDNFKTGIAILVQEILKADTSGSMYTIDPISNDKKRIVIEAVYGVQEKTHIHTPDHYEISKTDLLVNKKNLQTQATLTTLAGTKLKQTAVKQTLTKKQKLSDKEIIRLASLGKHIEQLFYYPQQIEWAIVNNNPYIIQSTVLSSISDQKATTEHSQEMVVHGIPASPGIASGTVKILHSAKDIEDIRKGDIIVIKSPTEEFVSALNLATALISETGSKSNILARKASLLGKPAVMGVDQFLSHLKSGMYITVNGTKGEVYKGANNRVQSISNFHKTATKLFLETDKVPGSETIELSDGVGIFHGDTIINDLGIHPKKLHSANQHYEYREKFIERLEPLVKAFQPKPIIYQISNLLTDQYRQLNGGKGLEPIEKNPILGYHGGLRHIHDAFTINLELDAILYLRNKLQYKNIWIMLPFIRDVEELIHIKKILSSKNLHRSPTLKLWVSLDVPANIFSLDKFIEAGIDGISINTDSLNMLFSGIDKQNDEVAHTAYTNEPAIRWIIEEVMKRTKQHALLTSLRYSSSNLHFAIETAIAKGISSLTVAPEISMSTKGTISTLEKKLIMKL